MILVLGFRQDLGASFKGISLVLVKCIFMIDLLAATLESGARELQLVEAQEFYANPRMQFTARQVR